ncbi:hypothetical protein [Mariprofundus ferrooxydans]|uniref:hypothetical protein n=1 Tax=Mariprofundus ferrooxydans TaxID=314344 RepID=UPI001430DB29|nr:hypothetical protein [Mariprofundus ferrooxydans]
MSVSVKYFLLVTALMIACGDAAAATAAAPQTFDLGIESMRSHSYSVFIFIFLMVGIALFLGIIAVFARTGKGAAGLKTGEKVMLGMIVLGVIAAIIFAALQLLDGFLF